MDVVSNCNIIVAGSEYTLLPVISSSIDALRIPKLQKMGMQMSDFIRELKRRECEGTERRALHYADLNNYMTEICWKYDGTIDASKTIKKLYIANILAKTKTTWEILTENCLEHCMGNLSLQICSSTANLSSDLIQSYWLYRRRPLLIFKVFPEITRPIWSSEGVSSLEEYFCILGFTNYHNSTLIRYFWNLMNDHQRKTVLLYLCSGALWDTMFSSNTRRADLGTQLLDQLSFYGLEQERIKALGSSEMLSHFLH